MSKRFGRNQKRKLKAKLEELQEENKFYEYERKNCFNNTPPPEPEIVTVSTLTGFTGVDNVNVKTVQTIVDLNPLFSRNRLNMEELYSAKYQPHLVAQMSRGISVNLQREIEFRVRTELEKILNNM
jgi:hypothetical protein